jgi:hypothetical protein
MFNASILKLNGMGYQVLDNSIHCANKDIERIELKLKYDYNLPSLFEFNKPYSFELDNIEFKNYLLFKTSWNPGINKKTIYTFLNLEYYIKELKRRGFCYQNILSNYKLEKIKCIAEFLKCEKCNGLGKTNFRSKYAICEKCNGYGLDCDKVEAKTNFDYLFKYCTPPLESIPLKFPKEYLYGKSQIPKSINHDLFLLKEMEKHLSKVVEIADIIALNQYKNNGDIKFEK